jgi:hypothetical protein
VHERCVEPIGPSVAKIWSQVLGADADVFGSASDFHRMGGDSVSLITMVAMVARQVVGPVGERAFSGRMPEIIRCATLEHVAELARLARTE